MWTHKAWAGRVLPRPTGGAERLRSYARWCNAVEGNTTFYATPSRATVESWARQTDQDFRFVVKLPKIITHERRFTGVDAELRNFLEVIELPPEHVVHDHDLLVQGVDKPGDGWAIRPSVAE